MPNPTNKIVFTQAQHQFLRDNYLKLTNPQLAAGLGLKLTRVRNEMRTLGLKRMYLQYWSKEQTQFLKDNFRRIGNKEIATIFDQKYPKEKGWSKSQVSKKLAQLGLKRNKLDHYLIKERNRKNGSYGKVNPKNNPLPPKVYLQLDSRTRIILTPNTDINKLKERYENRNILI